MKKLLYILGAAAIIAGCSKEDNTISYNETIGYMTNLSSVKYGILGRWIKEESISRFTQHIFNENKNVCYGLADSNSLTCVKYEILYLGGKYYLYTYPQNTDIALTWEIVHIDKYTLSTIYKHGYTPENTIIETYYKE